MLTQEAFGRALVLEPYFATVVLGGGVLRHGASAAQREAMIPAIAVGELRLALAHAEKSSGWDLFDVTATARKDGDGYILNGEKGLVLHCDSADKLIVLARVSGARRDKGGVGLFVVDAAAPAVARRGYPTQDGLRAAEITLTNARASEAIGDPEGGGAILERLIEDAIAALAAEAVGAMTEASRSPRNI
jgi:alkylation response protein AidB-like acyl-CoA dehydrogenase